MKYTASQKRQNVTNSPTTAHPWSSFDGEITGFIFGHANSGSQIRPSKRTKKR